MLSLYDLLAPLVHYIANAIPDGANSMMPARGGANLSGVNPPGPSGSGLGIEGESSNPKGKGSGTTDNETDFERQQRLAFTVAFFYMFFIFVYETYLIYDNYLLNIL